MIRTATGSYTMGQRFHTTRWSVVVNAGGEGDNARDALAALCRTYRPPVLAYVRARVAEPDAEDITQAFFAHILERRLPARADRERGRFRSYLLTSLKHFIVAERERANALRRGGGIAAVGDSAIEHVADADVGPEQAFEREWARTVLRDAIRQLELETERAGRGELFARLRQYLVDDPAEGEYDEIARALGTRRNTVAVAVHRMRARLQELVREIVADTADDPAEIDEELRSMRRVLVTQPPS
jgi:RNA polymerase sigma-70 factor (ECF subfamily)